MRIIVTCLLKAFIIAAIAGLVLANGLLQRRLGQAERKLAVNELAVAAVEYEAIAGSLKLTELVPGLLRQTRDGIRARRAAIRYWRGNYVGLLTDYPDLSGSDTSDNLPLQLAVVNAMYRAAQDGPNNREAVLAALDRAISAYQQVVVNGRGHGDAAYNYEYLIRQRNAVVNNGPWQDGSRAGALGVEGRHPVEVELDEYKVYVPLENDREEDTNDPTIGRDPPIRKRG